MTVDPNVESVRAKRPYFEGEHSYDHPTCRIIRAALATTKADTRAETSDCSEGPDD